MDDDPSDDSKTISINAVTPAAGKLVIGKKEQVRGVAGVQEELLR